MSLSARGAKPNTDMPKLLRPKKLSLSTAAGAGSNDTAGATDRKQSVFDFSARKIEKALAERAAKVAASTPKASVAKPRKPLAPPLARRSSMPVVDTRPPTAGHHKTKSAVVFPLPVFQYVAPRLKKAILTPRSAPSPTAASPNHTPRSQPDIVVLDRGADEKMLCVALHEEFQYEDFTATIEADRLTQLTTPIRHAAVIEMPPPPPPSGFDTESTMLTVSEEVHETVVVNAAAAEPVATAAAASPKTTARQNLMGLFVPPTQNELEAGNQPITSPALVSPAH